MAEAQITLAICRIHFEAADGERVMATRRPLARFAMLSITGCSLLMLLVSVGSCSLHLTPSIELVVRRGALEAAFCSHNVQSRNRDDWAMFIPPGSPGMIGCYPPRTFWYPTIQSDRVPYPAQNMAPGRIPPTFSISIVQVPLATLSTALAACSLWLWWPYLRRKSPQECTTCGYDLTGNVSGRCPECGSPATTRPIA